MIRSIVFHARLDSGVITDRFRFDDRCAITVGDGWDRTNRGGEVGSFVVVNIRVFEGVHGEELHAFMEAKGPTLFASGIAQSNASR